LQATPDLFPDDEPTGRRREVLAPGALVLRAFAAAQAAAVLESVTGIIQLSPWRHMSTPGGYRMSVATTSCGNVGWVTDHSGYRYDALDPTTGERWPQMPPVLRELAVQGAREAGFEGYAPDACLINRYEPGARLSLHQDRNERDMHSPVVSVSLGLPAVFLFGGQRRADRALRVPVAHGDVVVWGGPARLRFHGVQPLKEGNHPMLGACRVNLSFRKAR
jgi:DNA oxidative demethylase